MFPSYHDRLVFRKEVTDEELVTRSRNGSDRAAECLVRRYRRLVETRARGYYLAGADHDDVVQEGMIGLCKAIRDFSGDRTMRFRTFADMCVTRQIITAVKSATRRKHAPMNSYVSLSAPTAEADQECALIDCLADESARDPVSIIDRCEDTRPPMLRYRHLLSDLECKVLQGYLEGHSYREISSELACRQKSIDNALQRIKRKLMGVALLPAHRGV